MKQRLLGSFKNGPIVVYRGRPEWLQIQACNVPKTTTWVGGCKGMGLMDESVVLGSSTFF
jgi:hypothetical protein